VLDNTAWRSQRKQLDRLGGPPEAQPGKSLRR